MPKQRINRVYTKTGDDGSTSLVGGQRVSKSSSRVNSYGDVDELNATLGITRTDINYSDLLDTVTVLQNDLFIVGADLASPVGVDAPRVTQEMVENLEHLIDHYLKELEPLREFILPSGNRAGSYLHFARTVSRRAERSVARFFEDEEVRDSFVLTYLNRLSDLLFVMARTVNRRDNFEEIFVDFKKTGQ